MDRENFWKEEFYSYWMDRCDGEERCVVRKRQVVGLMGIQIMFARVIDRVSGYVGSQRGFFSIKSVRLDYESDEIRVMKYRQSLNL